MKAQALSMRRRIVASIASVALAFSMVGAVPGMALADGTVSVTPSSTEPSVDMGSTLSMSGEFTFGSYDTTAAHIDYVVTNGTGTATINKHNGTLTAVAAGEVTVTAYVTTGTKGNGSASVCGGTTSVIGSGSRTVTINAVQASGYDYQGGQLQIKMNTPTVTDTTSATDSDGKVTYTNTVPNQVAGSTVSFTFSQNAGLNQYLTYYSTWSYASPEAAYKALAGQNISYTDASGTTTTLAASTTMAVTSVTSSTVTISVPVGSVSSTGSNTCILHFDSDLHTFKQSDTSKVNKSLGSDVDFEFSVVSSESGESEL